MCCEEIKILNFYTISVANGDGSRQVTQKELEIAHTQGENFGKLVSTYVKGKTSA